SRVGGRPRARRLGGGGVARVQLVPAEPAAPRQRLGEHGPLDRAAHPARRRPPARGARAARRELPRGAGQALPGALAGAAARRRAAGAREDRLRRADGGLVAGARAGPCRRRATRTLATPLGAPRRGAVAEVSGMNIVHVVPNVSEEASGPAYSVPSLARGLGRLGHEVELLSVLGRPLPASPGFTHHVYPRALVLPRLWRSPALARALASRAQHAAVLHSHSLWAMPNIYPGWVARSASTRLVVSPRGTLSPWALGHSRQRKRLVWALLQGRVVRGADCLHATAEEEYRELRALGLRQPVCVIPNGVDVPPLSAADEPERPGPQIVLYIGRLHVKIGRAA